MQAHVSETMRRLLNKYTITQIISMSQHGQPLELDGTRYIVLSASQLEELGNNLSGVGGFDPEVVDKSTLDMIDRWQVPPPDKDLYDYETGRPKLRRTPKERFLDWISWLR